MNDLTERVALAIHAPFCQAYGSPCIGPQGSDYIRADAALAAVAAAPGLEEALAEVAYFEIAARQGLTILPNGLNRAKVPPHWRNAAEVMAKPYLDVVRAWLRGAG